MKRGVATAWITTLLAACATAAALDFSPAPAGDAPHGRTYRWWSAPGAVSDMGFGASVDARLAAKGWRREGTGAAFVLIAHPANARCAPAGHCDRHWTLEMIDPVSHQRVWQGRVEDSGGDAARNVALARTFAAFPMHATSR